MPGPCLQGQGDNGRFADKACRGIRRYRRFARGGANGLREGLHKVHGHYSLYQALAALQSSQDANEDALSTLVAYALVYTFTLIALRVPLGFALWLVPAGSRHARENGITS